MEEQLPDAAARQASELVIDALALQRRHSGGQVLGGERHVVKDAAPVRRQVLTVDHMQDRRVVIGIKPPPRKLERRPPAHLEAEQIAIKSPGGLGVVAQDRKVVHCRHAHALLLLPAISPAETRTRKKGKTSTTVNGSRAATSTGHERDAAVLFRRLQVCRTSAFGAASSSQAFTVIASML